MMIIDIKVIEHNSKAYFKMLQIRYEVLRKPLGLEYSKEQLLEERDQIHLVAYFENKIVGGLILVKENAQKIKMRQVAIDANFQSKGVGQCLVQYAEQYVKELSYEYMHCNARETALKFYQNLAYEIKGEVFLEVGIPHYYLYKIL